MIFKSGTAFDRDARSSPPHSLHSHAPSTHRQTHKPLHLYANKNIYIFLNIRMQRCHRLLIKRRVESEWKDDETAPRKNYDKMYVICVEQKPKSNGIFPSNAETICYVVKTKNLIRNCHSIVCRVLRIQYYTVYSFQR